MCGIIGAVASRPVRDMLLSGLARMEYRGYDSAGICVRQDGDLVCCKRPGKLRELRAAVARGRFSGHLGIGHTRWATHGGATEFNAHPHLGGDVAAVHNGIIENHEALRRRLEGRGASFRSETDSEVIPWLFAEHRRDRADPLQAWRRTIAELEGTYAIVAIAREDRPRLWFARRGSPLLLGRAGDDVFAASDVLALAGLAEEVYYLGEGEYGHIGRGECAVFDAAGRPVSLRWQPMPAAAAHADKGGFAHYMLKEIHEQPRVLADILQAYATESGIRFPAADFVHAAPLPDRIVMVACGTSYHAALTARYWLEHHLKVPVEVDVASEYRYRDPVIGENTWLVTLSQSGETADTLEALRLFKRRTPQNLTLALCNVGHSSLTRESHGVIELLAGPEIGVASTKAFTAQLAVLALLTLTLAERSGAVDVGGLEGHLRALRRAVRDLAHLLERSEAIAELAPMFLSAHGALYLGRGPCFPLALEGALKLKEISYLHAEGYAAGEMKHGPIALIDERLPVVVLAPRRYHLEKVLANLSEVRARGARVVLLTDLDEKDWPDGVERVIHVPGGDEYTTPLLLAVPLQLLAYHVARAKGTDVDQPRNLAKSVTVE